MNSRVEHFDGRDLPSTGFRGAEPGSGPRQYESERDLFLTLIRARPPAELVEAGVIDWSGVASLATRHKATAVFYRNLNELGLRDRLPPAVDEALRRRFFQIIARNLRLLKRLEAVVGLLGDRGIPVVPFKGPVLAHRLYGDPALRQYSDLDLLTPRESAVAAYRTLRAAGYRPMDVDVTEGQFRTLTRFTKAFNFIGPSGDVAIDLHWHLSFHTCRRFDYRFCRDRLTSVSIADREMPSLSDEDMLVYLCVHGVSHGWPDARAAAWVADYIDLRPDLDWDRVFTLADALHCRRMVLMGLFLVQTLFRSPLPAPVRDRMAADKTARTMAEERAATLFTKDEARDHAGRRLSEIPFFLALRDRRADRVRYLVRRLFHPTIKDWRTSPLPPRLSFLYFLLRPVALCADLARARIGRR